jgi:hypothetical protein
MGHWAEQCHSWDFKGGIYLAKTAAVPLIEAELPKRQARLAELVGELCNRTTGPDGKTDSVYDRKVREARDDLQELFDVRDYPTGAELARVFSIEWNWVAFTVPEGLPPELTASGSEEAPATIRGSRRRDSDCAAIWLQKTSGPRR